MFDRPVFDRYVVVDWSANGRPKRGRDSIWIAFGGRSGAIELANPPTRREAESIIGDLISEPRRRRTLLAVDASLGFPVGSADRFALDGETPRHAIWSHLERRLVDDARNRNDRFEVAAELNRRRAPGPFWGCPPRRVIDGLGARKPTERVLPEFRTVEAVLRSEGLRPASVWQLLGAGSVGSQTLTILPVLDRLVRRGGVEVWPFTTGLTLPIVDPGETVVAEIWPTAFPVDLRAHPVRDAAQVVSVVENLRRADEQAELDGWFEPDVDERFVGAVVAEEGWLLRPGR